jgi:hypothetical protein
MGDPETATYYDIIPNSSFTTANTQFMPSRKYTVSAAVYNSSLEDGTTFASHCASAKPRTGTPG